MFEKMRAVIATQLNLEEENVTLNSSLKDDLGADSLDLFEMVMAIEEEFDTEIPTEDLAGLETVEDVLNYLKAKGIED